MLKTFLLALLGILLLTINPVRAQVCGDGILDGGEQCDDDNVTPNDGCGDTCQCEGLEIDVEILDWTPTACQQGDLLTVTFRVNFSSWAIWEPDWVQCYTEENWATGFCNSSGYCTCSVVPVESDFTYTTTGNPIDLGVEVWVDHPMGCNCGCSDYAWDEVEWFEQCGWCTDDANCTGDGGCAEFTCNLETGYCEVDSGVYEATLNDECGAEICVAKQCKGSTRGEQPCYADEDCPLGSCVVATCDAGASEGLPCYHVDIDRRREANLAEAYMFACYLGGGSCVQGSSTDPSAVATYPLCNDNDPCTLDVCTAGLPFAQMCSHQAQPCDASAGSVPAQSRTEGIITLSVIGGIIAVLLFSGAAIANGRG